MPLRPCSPPTGTTQEGAGSDARDARLQPVDVGMGTVARRGGVKQGPKHPQAPTASDEAVAERRVTARKREPS
jgi:hypothetical protein